MKQMTKYIEFIEKMYEKGIISKEVYEKAISKAKNK